MVGLGTSGFEQVKSAFRFVGKNGLICSFVSLNPFGESIDLVLGSLC